MAVLGVSSIAVHIPKFKDWQGDGNDRKRVWGIMLHQTGSALPEAAVKKKVDVLEYAVAHYSRPGTYWAHYVIGYDGTIVQISNELEIAYHVGVPASHRRAYLDGSWKKKVSALTVKLWNTAWSKYSSPSHLYPSKSPNTDYIGVEIIPRVGKNAYTEEQHKAVIELCKDVAIRWSFPVGWAKSGRLVGHEDVSPLTRSQTSGGWDPGALRTKPWFDFVRVRSEL